MCNKYSKVIKFNKYILKRLGEIMAASKIREMIMEDLKEEEEIIPDEHDGSYELMRETIRSYMKVKDTSVLDYNDLNLIYLMSVGTWKKSIDKRKDTINESNLPKREKQRLIGAMERIWQNAINEKYENIVGNKPSLGMFGTGFFSFKGKTDKNTVVRFINLCTEIIDMDDDEDIFNKAEEVLDEDIRGMKAASASMILHCLKPYTFPIFNSNMGNGNIFERLGVDLAKKTEIYTYIKNCREVKRFRDENFDFKNYRVFDIAASNPKYDDDYYPLLEKYDPKISKEEYEKILTDESIINPNWLDVLYCLYEMDGIGTCKQISNIYGNSPSHYNSNARSIAKAIHDETKCDLYKGSDGRDMFWPILFFGKNLSNKSEGVYMYKMRKPLYDAIESMYEQEEQQHYYHNNRILYGPPGTGKTYNTVKYAVAICDGIDIDDLEDYDEVLNRYNALKKQGRIEFITFHQSYGYEEFIEGIRPETKDGNLTYKLKDGIFKSFCKRAAKANDKQPYVFIIDEINRGNISKIFGELITLIEEGKRLGREEAIEAVLPYSGETFGVPDNVYIVGTMNTADRSIALMDTALRRRFKFIEKMPDADILREIGADIVEDEDGEEIDVATMLEIINERIEYLYDREHTIGHAFFIELKDDNSIEALGNIFEEAIIPLLQEYFYEDYSKIQLVLGDNCKSSDDYKFILDEKLIVKDIFNGNVDDVDLPEKKYTIQEDAFLDINSYREIGEGI